MDAGLSGTLGKVDWGRYHHAYGPATDVPGLLRALASEPDAPATLRGEAARAGRSLFEHVTWTLWGNVFHQGTVWGVSAKTIPFFMELLATHPSVEHRRFLVDYLHHLALGYPEDRFPAQPDLDRLLTEAARIDRAELPQSLLDGAGFGALRPGTEDEAAAVAAVWARDCYVAVEERIQAVCPSLHDDDEEVAGSTAALVASFPRRAGDTIPSLWRVAREALDSPLAGIALVALAQLGAEGVPAAARVADDAAGGSHVGGVFAAVADVLASATGAASPSSQFRLLTVPSDWLDVRCPFTGRLGNLVDRATLSLQMATRG